MGWGSATEESLAASERAHLADLLHSTGPDAPTLCEGWLTRDLVAHLVVREGHAAASGLALPWLRAWTERTQGSLARRSTDAESYDSLVERFRSGPPWYSPLGIPGVESVTNTLEFFVHHEDVRRAGMDWQPRMLDDIDQRTLWQQLAARTRLLIPRAAPVDLDIVAVDADRVRYGHIHVRRASRADPSAEASRIVVRGTPEELAYYLHGRRHHARVDLTGPASARAAWDSFATRV